MASASAPIFMAWKSCSTGVSIGSSFVVSSAGAAVTTVSRDMLRMMRSFDIFRLFSFYCSMAGFYVTTLQSMWSVYLLALTQLILAVMSMETYEKFDYALIEEPEPVNHTLCALNASAASNCPKPTPPENFFEIDWRQWFRDFINVDWAAIFSLSARMPASVDSV